MLTREQAAARAQAIAGSPADKEAYMDALRFPHANQDKVINVIRNQAKPGAGLSITLVVGGTGAGKSTLGRMQLADYISSNAVAIDNDSSLIPAVMCEVDAVDASTRELNWPLQYTHLCHALLAPSILDGINNYQELGKSRDLVRNSRLMFENALKERGTKYLILDEAVHFSRAKGDPREYGNLLKSLANRAGFHLLLLGAYGSEEIAVATDQLSRRVEVVHYSRYKPTREDFTEYCKFVKSVAEALPLACKVDIADQVEYMFYGTFGFGGQSVDVLRRAVKKCDADGGRQWRNEFLFSSMPSERAHRKIVKDTLVGEDAVQSYLQKDSKHNYITEKQARDELLLDAEAANRSTQRKQG